MTSDPLLRRWYLKFNTLYFASQLPTEDVFLFWEPVEKCDADCVPVKNHRDQVTGDIVIRIDPGLRTHTRIVKMCLLHEMVHLSVWPYSHHGKKFQDEMKRLVAAEAFKNLW